MILFKKIVKKNAQKIAQKIGGSISPSSFNFLSNSVACVEQSTYTRSEIKWKK